MRVLFALLFLCCQNVFGQSFILNQFFQPSISVNAEYCHDYQPLRDRWSFGRINANVIIPVKSKLGLEMDWIELLKVKKLSDLTKVAKVKAYQIFWTFRPQVTYLQYEPLSPRPSPFDSLGGPELSYGLSTGITGLHLIKKVRILFYTVNVGVQESPSSIGKMVPSVNAMVGVVNFNKVMYYWYYGLYAGHNQGRFSVPVPFFGVDLHLAKKLWWNITLPIQTRFEYKASRFVKFDAVASLATYDWGFGIEQLDGSLKRHFVQGYQFRSGLAINVKTKRGTKFYLEGGYMPFRRFGFDRYRDTNSTLSDPSVQPAPYVAFSMFYGFKKSLLGSTVESFLNF